MIEVSVKVSNEESKLIKKFVVYDTVTVSKEDDQLKDMVKNVVDAFKGNVDDVFITIKMSW